MKRDNKSFLLISFSSKIDFLNKKIPSNHKMFNLQTVYLLRMKLFKNIFDN